MKFKSTSEIAKYYQNKINNGDKEALKSLKSKNNSNSSVITEEDLPKLKLDVAIDTSTLSANIQTALKAVQTTEGKLDFNIGDKNAVAEPYKIATKELKTLYNLRLQYAKISDPSTETATLFKTQIAEQQKTYEKAIPKEGTPEFNTGQANQLILQRIALEDRLQATLHKSAQALIEKNNAEATAANRIFELQQKLAFRIDNTLSGDLSSGDYDALLNLKDGLNQVDLASGKAEQEISTEIYLQPYVSNI